MTEDTRARLTALGCDVLRMQVNVAGKEVYLVQSKPNGWDVAMFAPDATELANGKTTIQDIINKNKGADLADPWPALERLNT